MRLTIAMIIALCVNLNLTGWAQVKRLDSLKLELQRADKNRYFPTLMFIFSENLKISYDSALIYSEKLVQWSLVNEDSLNIVKSFNARGFAKRKLGLASCISDFEFALAIAKRNKFSDQVIFLLNNLALSHSDFANYDKALDYNFQSLQLREEAGDANSISIALNNIGIVYSNLKDFQNALSFFIRCRDMKESNDIPYDLDRAYVNIAEAYFNLENYDAADKSIAKVFDLCRSGCKDDVLAEARFVMARILIKQEDYDQALSELDGIIEISERNGFRSYEAQSLYFKSLISFQRAELNLALRYLRESDAVLEVTELRDQILDNYLLHTSIYKNLGDFEKASEYQQKYIDLNNSVFSGDLIKNISRIQTQFEERENLKTIAAKDQVLMLQEEIIARQKSQYAFIITITFLAVGLALVMYRANQFQRKANQELAVAKETIQNQNLILEQQVKARTKELFESNESLTKANEELDNFIYKTSHDIRGPLASLKGMCNIAMLDVKDKLALEYLEKLDTTAAKLNVILSRLLIINQINHSLLSPEYLKLEDQIEEILELERKKGIPERLQVSYEVPKELTLRSDREMTKIVLENLIDNAIKFYNESERVQPFVKIKVSEEQGRVLVKVTDNGIGIRNESRDKIFQLFVRASERSDTGGIGLYLSKLATQKLGGTIHFTTTPEGYTEFTVTFPMDLVPLIEARRLEQVESRRRDQTT